jgi:SAM-dependent methyltransferase
VTSFAKPVPLGERWLERDEVTEDTEGAPQLDSWYAREESWRRFAPFDLEEPGPRPTREERGLCETWFPVKEIARAAHALLRAHFELSGFDPRWRCDLLARAASWLDARHALRSLPALPSSFLASLEDPDRAEAFAFEAHDPPSHGQGAVRYPEALARIAELAPALVWDAGCGTGEIAHAIARHAGEVIGTTPSPWELLMAQRRGRPHDRARTLAYRRATEGVTNARFELGDLRRAPASDVDLVFVGGVLGGVVASDDDVGLSLATVARALRADGKAIVADRFRQDRHERARRLVLAHAPRAGLSATVRTEYIELEKGSPLA